MTDDEDFDKAMSDVKPLSQDKIALTKASQKLPQSTLNTRQVAASEWAKDDNHLTTEVLELLAPNEVLSYKLSGLQNGVFRKLRLGKYPSEAHLDLHRRTVKQARNDVFSFLNQCLRYQLRTVIITHGKGLSSERPAQLKSFVNLWLPQFSFVQAFHSCVPKHGGTGAVYVLLAKSREQSIDNKEMHRKGR